MKKILLVLSVALWSIAANSQVVIDKGQFFSDSEITLLKADAQNLKDKYTIETLIFTTMDLGGKTPFDYVQDLGRNYKVGEKGVNNGIIILLSKKERKLQILNGCGIEWLISDVQTQEIVNQMIEFFKKQNYFGGLQEGLTLIEKRVSSVSWEVEPTSLDELTKNDVGKIINFTYSNKTGDEKFTSATDTDPQFSNDFHVMLPSKNGEFMLFYSKHMNEIVSAALKMKYHQVYARPVSWDDKRLELMGTN